jgi:(2R)-3-sulfolactate dehydrogenase (NADP+)
MTAARDETPIPEDWAFDAQGQPTTDPKAAMAGTMRAMGDAKGTQLVLMVELFAAALTGSNFGFEASSFFEAQGPAPRTGQFLIAVDPDRFAGGGFADRMETIVAAILDQPGTRLPGLRRFDARAAAERDGVTLSTALYDEIIAAGQTGS